LEKYFSTVEKFWGGGPHLFIRRTIRVTLSGLRFDRIAGGVRDRVKALVVCRACPAAC
jgi:hypothetical protein